MAPDNLDSTAEAELLLALLFSLVLSSNPLRLCDANPAEGFNLYRGTPFELVS